MPSIKMSNFWMLGPQDKMLLRKANIRSLDWEIEFYDGAICKSNIEVLACKVLKRLAPKGEKSWLHVDLDVLSTRSLPAVDYRQAGELKPARNAHTKILTVGNVI